MISVLARPISRTHDKLVVDSTGAVPFFRDYQHAYQIAIEQNITDAIVVEHRDLNHAKEMISLPLVPFERTRRLVWN